MAFHQADGLSSRAHALRAGIQRCSSQQPTAPAHFVCSDRNQSPLLSAPVSLRNQTDDNVGIQFAMHAMDIDLSVVIKPFLSVQIFYQGRFILQQDFDQPHQTAGEVDKENEAAQGVTVSGDVGVWNQITLIKSAVENLNFSCPT